MATAAAAIHRTLQTFQRSAHLTTLSTTILSVQAISALQEADRALYKAAITEDSHVVVTPETIFHPQGGGQPSDEGTITSRNNNNCDDGDAGGNGGGEEEEEGSAVVFNVKMVRMSVTRQGEVLHFGEFTGGGGGSSGGGNGGKKKYFTPGEQVMQAIDAEKRLLYSRYHTAGHVLGSAVRHLAQDSVDGFDELNADHTPGSAACNFQGLLEGKWKDEFQKKLDEYVAADMPVEIGWWDEEDFIREGLQRLIPDRRQLGMEDGEKFRVVTIVGAETYPCGGTHVDSTKLCGKTTARKIGRSKGMSRVSYALVD